MRLTRAVPLRGPRQAGPSKVGAVAAREVSRFARDSRDWQQLVEMCRVVDTPLIGQETVYAPRQGNDRLLLGLKGSLNEYELDLLRRYAADRAFRQYDAADPENRLMTGDAGTARSSTSPGSSAGSSSMTPPMSLEALADDLQAVWAGPTTDARLKKRIVRAVIHEAIADPNILKAVRALALIARDDVIAGVLNRDGLGTGHGNRWTRERVTSPRNSHQIPVHRPVEG